MTAQLPEKHIARATYSHMVYRCNRELTNTNEAGKIRALGPIEFRSVVSGRVSKLDNQEIENLFKTCAARGFQFDAAWKQINHAVTATRQREQLAEATAPRVTKASNRVNPTISACQAIAGVALTAVVLAGMLYR